MGDEVIRAYIKSCQSPFTLSADGILQLKDAGVTSPLIAAMLAHDTSLRGQNPPAAFNYNQRLYPPAEQTPGAARSGPTGSPTAVRCPRAWPGAGRPDPGLQPGPRRSSRSPPGPDYYWAPGYWGWDNGWIWVGGVWRSALAWDGVVGAGDGAGLVTAAGMGMGRPRRMGRLPRRRMGRPWRFRTRWRPRTVTPKRPGCCRNPGHYSLASGTSGHSPAGPLGPDDSGVGRGTVTESQSSQLAEARPCRAGPV